MDNEQKPELPRGPAPVRLSDACEALLLAIVMLMVFSLTAWISVHIPQALDAAARHAHAAGIVVMEADAPDDAPEAEAPATEIADDLRAQMQALAAAWFYDAAEG